MRNTPEKLTVITLCSVETVHIPTDFQLRKTLKPLLTFQKVQNKDISNPCLSRSAPMETTFVHSAGTRTRGVWRLIEKATRADIRLAEMEHPSLKDSLSYCLGRVPIFVHPCFYRALKLKYPLDVGGVSRDGWVTTELGTGSLRHAVGVLTPEDLRAVVDSKWGKWVW